MLTGAARVAGVIGWPVSHSRSPRLHGHWLAQAGIDGAYVPLPVDPARLPPGGFRAVLEGLAAAGLRGCNVTVPHKQAAWAACDELDASARRAGAVNTLVFEGGRILGSNTDGWGFLASLREQVPGWDAAAGPAVVLGAGGAARAVAAALLDAECPRVTLFNRDAARAGALARVLGAGEGSAAAGGSIVVVPPSGLVPALAGAALLVNATSLGMVGQPSLDLDLALLPAAALVTDLVYVPLETPLLAAAHARDLRTADGLGMLLHQARPGFRAWFGVLPEVDAALRAHVAADIPSTTPA